jgi:hypothetical protein
MKYQIQFFNEIKWVDSTFYAYIEEDAIKTLNFLNNNSSVQYRLIINEENV